MSISMLTTLDNPYNPKEDYGKWMQWDHENGYYTAEYVARIADLPDRHEGLPDKQLNELIEAAQIEILENDNLDIYKLV